MQVVVVGLGQGEEGDGRRPQRSEDDLQYCQHQNHQNPQQHIRRGTDSKSISSKPKRLKLRNSNLLAEYSSSSSSSSSLFYPSYRLLFYLGLFGIFSTSFWLGVYDGDQTSSSSVGDGSTTHHQSSSFESFASKYTLYSSSDDDDTTIQGSSSNHQIIPSPQRENATILVLCRESDLDGILHSMFSFESTFNSKFLYPYTFFIDGQDLFSRKFQMGVRNATKANVEFVQIPWEHWSYPPHINQPRSRQIYQDMAKRHIIYGGSESYRFMCRWNAGFFYRHEVMLKYRYYWRLEPDVDFYCRVDEDPFTVMRLGGKKYGWNIMGVEFMATIPTLFETTMDFLKTWQNKYPPPSPLKSSLVHLSTFSSSSSTSSPSDSLDRLSGKFTPEPYFTASTTLPNFLFPRHMRPFLSNLQFLSTTTSLPNHPYPDSSTPPSYNGMHFWSNFEIADLDWFRGEEYSAYFSFLDETGGFFYERWGDAPIHSLAVAMFLDESEVHHFYGIGYRHTSHQHCPKDIPSRGIYYKDKCNCSPYIGKDKTSWTSYYRDYVDWMDGYAEWRALESVEMYEEKWRDDVGDNDPKINIHVQQTEEEFTAMLHLILARSSATSSSSSSS